MPVAAKSTTVPSAPVVLAVRRNLSQKITLTAELRPYEEVKVYAKVSGYLKTINVDYGDRVKGGEVLATLEVPEQKDDLDRAKAAYGIAKLEYDRLVAVAKEKPGLLAQAEIDKADAAFETAKANLDRERALNSYTQIVAPFDGVVTERYFDPGALIQAGTASQGQSEPIVRISDNYRLRLVIQIPESIVPKIDVGTPVVVRMQSTGEKLQGKVARLSERVLDNTRTMHIEVDLDNQDLRMTPGMYAWVDVEVANRQGVVAVPLQSLTTGQSPSVWVVTPQHSIVERPVTVGIETADWAEITKGLQPGEMILFGSRAAFSPGMSVEPKTVSQTMEADSNDGGQPIAPDPKDPNQATTAPPQPVNQSIAAGPKPVDGVGPDNAKTVGQSIPTE